MFKNMSPSRKKKEISVLRDFPGDVSQGDVLTAKSSSRIVIARDEPREILIGAKRCRVSGAVDHDQNQSKRRRSDQPGISGSGESGRFVSATSGSTVQALSRQIQRNSPQEEKKKISDAADGRRSAKAQLIPIVRRSRILEELSPREKVMKTLSLFRTVYEALEHDRAVNPGEANTPMVRLNHEARAVVLNSERQVNAEKRIGAVPGIEVGDQFQFKVELNLIGLHFDMMRGIDYMRRGNLKLATSIVASEGSGYSDIFESGVLTYTGEGGNVTRTDQQLVKGNLALATSVTEQNPVRVIRRKDQSGSHYVYDGLYLVESYWQERGPRGNLVFKFRLVRVTDEV